MYCTKITRSNYYVMPPKPFENSILLLTGFFLALVLAFTSWNATGSSASIFRLQRWSSTVLVDPEYWSDRLRIQRTTWVGSNLWHTRGRSTSQASCIAWPCRGEDGVRCPEPRFQARTGQERNIVPHQPGCGNSHQQCDDQCDPQYQQRYLEMS